MDVSNAIWEYLNHLKVERQLSPNSIAAYRRDLSRYAEFLRARGKIDFHEINAEDLVEYQKHLSAPTEKLAASSINRMLAAVRGLHKFAVLERWHTIDLGAELASIRVGARLPKALSVSDTVSLIGVYAAKDEPLAIRDTAILEFLYGTGARISELVNLRLHDLLPEGAVRLMGKGRKERLVPIGSTAVQKLDAYLVRVRPNLLKDSTDLVFLNRSGKSLSRQAAFKIVSQAAQAANLTSDVSPHTLRHCYATHLLQGGADVRVVQELLGHASVATTQIYTYVTIDTLRETYVLAHPRSRKK